MQAAMRTELRLATSQCRAVVGRKDNGQPRHCLQVWRRVTTDGEFRYGTMTCMDGHKATGKAAKLANPLKAKKAAKKRGR